MDQALFQGSNFGLEFRDFLISGIDPVILVSSFALLVA
jgi:hypothetical protein